MENYKARELIYQLSIAKLQVTNSCLTRTDYMYRIQSSEFRERINKLHEDAQDMIQCDHSEWFPVFLEEDMSTGKPEVKPLFAFCNVCHRVGSLSGYARSRSVGHAEHKISVKWAELPRKQVDAPVVSRALDPEKDLQEMVTIEGRKCFVCVEGTYGKSDNFHKEGTVECCLCHDVQPYDVTSVEFMEMVEERNERVLGRNSKTLATLRKEAHENRNVSLEGVNCIECNVGFYVLNKETENSVFCTECKDKQKHQMHINDFKDMIVAKTVSRNSPNKEKNNESV